MNEAVPHYDEILLQGVKIGQFSVENAQQGVYDALVTGGLEHFFSSEDEIIGVLRVISLNFDETEEL